MQKKNLKNRISFDSVYGECDWPRQAAQLSAAHWQCQYAIVTQFLPISYSRSNPAHGKSELSLYLRAHFMAFSLTFSHLHKNGYLRLFAAILLELATRWND